MCKKCMKYFFFTKAIKMYTGGSFRFIMDNKKVNGKNVTSLCICDLTDLGVWSDVRACMCVCVHARTRAF